MVDIPGLSGVDVMGASGAAMGKIAYVVGYAIIIIAVLAAIYFIYYYMGFNIKATIYPMYGSGKDGQFSFGPPKYNRYKWIKSRTAWAAMKPYFNGRELEPFDSEYIYPGNNITAFELNGVLTPARINIDKSEAEIRAHINPVPYYTRNWQSLQYKKNAIEFAKHDWWSDNKSMAMSLITCALCLALVGFTIWLIYKYAFGSMDNIKDLTAAIQNIGVVKGVLPT
jgi:hypothetical protein